jgi:hypothetical protein
LSMYNQKVNRFAPQSHLTSSSLTSSHAEDNNETLWVSDE